METVITKDSISFAEGIFDRLGLKKCISSIFDEIEEEFAGSYSQTNYEGDDWSTSATYGGTLTDTYILIEDGKFCVPLKHHLNSAEQQFLLILSQNQKLEIAVERADHFGQLWTLAFTVPLVPNNPNSDTLELSYQLTISTQGKLSSLQASSNRELDEFQLKRLLFLYSMKL